MGLRGALQGSSPGPAGAEAASRVQPAAACRRLLLCLCRAFPGPGAGLWAPRGPSQSRRVRHGAEMGKGTGVARGVLKWAMGKGYWKGKEGQGQRKKAESNRKLLPRCGSSESPCLRKLKTWQAQFW